MLKEPDTISIPDIQEDEIDTGPIFVLCGDGMWRCYDGDGVIAAAFTFREIYELSGSRWN